MSERCEVCGDPRCDCPKLLRRRDLASVEYGVCQGCGSRLTKGVNGSFVAVDSERQAQDASETANLLDQLRQTVEHLRAALAYYATSTEIDAEGAEWEVLHGPQVAREALGLDKEQGK